MEDIITCDRLYDNLRTNISPENKKTIMEIERVVNKLLARVNCFAEPVQSDLVKLIKGLAFFKACNDGYKGVYIKELVEGLDLLNQDIDDIKDILLQLRKKTGGQFIDCIGDDYFTLDLIHCIDYEEVIDQKAEQLSGELEEKGFLKFLEEVFGLVDDKRISEGIYTDYFPWPARNSFRNCYVVFNNQDDIRDDFTLVISLSSSDFSYKPGKKKAVLNLYDSEELSHLVRKLVVLEPLTKSSNYPVEFVYSKIKEIKGNAKKLLLTVLLQSKIYYQGQEKKVSSFLDRAISNLEEVYLELKTRLFNDVFNDSYPYYPDLPFELNPANCQIIIENTIRVLLIEEPIKSNEAKVLLVSLSLLDEDNYLDITSSPYVSPVIDLLKEKPSQETDISKIFFLLKSELYGLNEDLIYLLLVVLAYLGQIELRQKDGLKIGIDGLENYFLHKMSLFSSGLENMKGIKFIVLNDNSSLSSLSDLFQMLGLAPELFQPGKNLYQTLVKYKEKVAALEEKLARVELYLDQIEKDITFFKPEIVREKRAGLNRLPMRKLTEVKSVSSLKDLFFNRSEIEELEISLRYLDNLDDFLINLTENILSNYKSILEGIKDSESSQVPVRELMDKAWEMIDDKEIRDELRKEIYRLK